MNFNEIQSKQFNKYYDLLIDWNNRINLTAITDRDEVWLKHFSDSVSIDKIIDMNTIDSVIDVGTGAGFPGIPLKIMYPNIRLTLLDSLDKRVRFLNTVIDELGLTNVTAIHGRAEDIARDTLYRERFDLCVSRAVASLPVLTELCVPFVKVGGSFISYKSEKAKEEIKDADRAITIMGATITKVEEFNLAETDNLRVLIKLDKINPTPNDYPRRAGIPGKKPIK